MNFLIYLAYGLPDLVSEAILSILSYEHVAAPDGAQILVYTDQQAAFERVLGTRPHVQYPRISPEQWQQWKGRHVFMLKIAVLQHAAAHHPGNLLFVDTDTIWQLDPAPLFAAIGRGQLLMHADENLLARGNALSRKTYRHLRGRQWRIGSHTHTIDATTRMYNSGLIGFRSAAAAMLPEVQELAEQLFAAYHKHIMEQLAFSIRLQAEGPVAEAAPYVLHYWNLKDVRPALTRLVGRYDSRSTDALFAHFTRLNIGQIHQQELAYRDLPNWRRQWLKLRGRQWQLPSLDV